MDIRIQVRFENGFELLNRQLESMVITNRLNDYHLCELVFDSRDGGPERLEELFGRIEVTAEEVDAAPGRIPRRAMLFRGVMIDGNQAHQFYGRSRFTIRAASRLLYGMHRYHAASTALWSAENFFHHAQFIVVDPPRYRSALAGAWMGESQLEYCLRLAGLQGYMVRELLDEAIELRTAFVDPPHQLVWGTADLVALRTEAALANGHVRGVMYDPTLKRDIRFRHVSETPEVGGAGQLAQRIRQVSPGAPGSHSDLPDVPNRDHAPRTFLGGVGDFVIPHLRESLQRESERAWGTAVTIEGVTHHIELRAGDKVDIVPHPEAAYRLPSANGEFGLVEVEHRYDEEGYRSRFIATPWKHYSAPARPKPGFVGGPLVAEVVDYPSTPGHVVVRFPWMPADSNIRHGLEARLVTPFAGNQRGFTFLPEIGDEVLVAFENGDPDRPYVIGSCWNGQDECLGRSPKRIVTKSGNSIVMDDHGKIEIYSPGGQCLVQLANDVNGKPRLTIHSEGDLALEAPNGLVSITCQDLVEKARTIHRDVDEVTETVNGTKASVSGMLFLTSTRYTLIDGSNLELQANSVEVNGSDALDLHSGGQTVLRGQTVDLNPPVPPVHQAPDMEVIGTPFPLESNWHGRPRPAATDRFQSQDN